MAEILTKEEIDELLGIECDFFEDTVLTKQDIKVLNHYKNKSHLAPLFYKFINYSRCRFFNESIKTGFFILKLENDNKLSIKKFYNVFDDFLLHQRIRDYYPKANIYSVEFAMKKLKKINRKYKNFNYLDVSSVENHIYLGELDTLGDFNIAKAYDYLRYHFLKKYIID